VSRRIVIVGPSASGKTTLATAIAQELGCPMLSMDDYRQRGMYFVQHEGRKVRNYEDPRGWDANAIMCKLRVLCNVGQGFVAEGNHLLRYPDIAAIPEIETYYIDLSFATCLSRRKTRNRGTEPDWSFAQIGRRMTCEIVYPQRDVPGIRILDGTLPTAELARRILQPALST